MLFKYAEKLGSTRMATSEWGIWNPQRQAFDDVSFVEGLNRLPALVGSIPQESLTNLPMPVSASFGGTKIICVGRNYRPHVQELGNEIPREPLWFTKPPSSLLEHQGVVRLPEGFGRIDYEGEMAIVIGRRARHVTADKALPFIAGVTLALDITARELQKSDGQWTRAKGFDTFCPLGPVILPFEQGWLDCSLTTTLNGNLVQKDRLSSLIFSVQKLIEHVSACMTLEVGDVLLTGTPAGVGPLKPGDHLTVEAEGPMRLSLSVSVEKENDVREKGG
ncbi:MAG: fumarylacetoacetate hydrolase family protein [Candidatus Ozemobacteraceae bacterium]